MAASSALKRSVTPARRAEATSSRTAPAVSRTRRWVMTVATRPASHAHRLERRRHVVARRPRRAPSASQANVSRLPAGPGSPLGAKPITRAAERPPHAATAATASRRSAGSRTTPPLPTRSRPTSNCGLTIARQSNSRRRRSASTAGSTFVSEMNETSITIREGGTGAAASHGPRVDALDHRDPRIVAQPVVELAVGDVERDHARCAALQQAVGEAAGRGADVERAAPARRRRRARRARWRASHPRVRRTPARRRRRCRRRRRPRAATACSRAAAPSRPGPRRPCTAAAARERDSNRPRSASRLSSRTRAPVAGTTRSAPQAPASERRGSSTAASMRSAIASPVKPTSSCRSFGAPCVT